MPTLLLASCATQRPSIGTSASDSSRIAWSWLTACCSASGAGGTTVGADDDADAEDEADADGLSAVDRPPGSMPLLALSGPAWDAPPPCDAPPPDAGLSVAAAVSV